MGVQTLCSFFIKERIISLLKNITSLSVAQVLTAICNFFSVILIARMLGPEMQGEWTLYLNAFTFGTIALGLGLSPALNHFLAAGKVEKKSLIGQLFFFSLLVASVFLIALFAIDKSSLKDVFLPRRGNARFVCIGLSLHLLFLIFNQLLTSILLAEKRFTKAAQLSTLGAVCLLLSYFGFYVLGNSNRVEYFQFFIALNIVVLLLQTILYLVSILKDQRYSFQLRFFNLDLAKLLISFALLAYATNFIQFLNYKMDIWFINAYVQEEAKLGIYAVSVSLAQLIWLVPNAFHSVIFTSVSENQHTVSVTKGTILTWSKVIFLVSIGLGIMGYLLSVWLVPSLFGEAYRYILEIFPFLLPGIVLFTPSILFSAYIAGKKRIDINLKASLIGFIMAFTGSMLLIPSYGVLGAAGATSISYFFSSIYTYYKFMKLT